jgi:peptidylprolyl isomerase
VGSRTGSQQGGTTSNRRGSTKAARREALRVAAAKAAATRRRRRLFAIWGTGAAVLAAIAVGIVVSFVVPSGSGDDSSPGSSAGSSTSAATGGSSSTGGSDTTGRSAALGSKPKVEAGSGELTELKVTTLVQGDGPAVTSGQNISVNYVGVSYKTGKEFDSSWSRSQPFSFSIGAGRVIQGWDKGLLGVKVGSRVQLDIPSAMAYGDSAANGAPSGPLRFVVDVLTAK